MHEELAHNQLAQHRFLQNYQTTLTTRPDGRSWPNRERTWVHASQYVRGLIRPGKRKTITGIASRMSADQERLERFVRESPWEHDAVQRHLQQTVPDGFQGPDAVLILDGLGFPKQGDHSVGVARQWCGATGKIDNCQVTVNLTLCTPDEERNADQVTWPLGMQLFLPKTWAGVDEAYTDDEERFRYEGLRDKARVPESIGYRSKPEIGLDLIDQALENDLEHGCVVADANFGRDGGFRKQLRAWDEAYVVGVQPSKLRVIPAQTPIEEPGPTQGRGPSSKHPRYPEAIEPVSAVAIAERVEVENAWERVSWGEGTKGELSGLFYRERVRTVEKVQHRWVFKEVAWLVLEKREDEGEVRAYLCWGLDQATQAPGDDAPAEVSLAGLAGIAHVRWTIERFHQDIKQVLGAGDFQGRTWRGFHHHLSAVLLAHAFIAQQRAQAEEEGRLPSFEETVERIVEETAVQRLMANHGFDRVKARGVAVDMLRGFSEWG